MGDLEHGTETVPPGCGRSLYQAVRASPPPLKRLLATLIEPKRTRKRKPTLAGVAKKAAKANIPVAAYEVRGDGTIGIVVGKPGDAKPDNTDEWDGVVLP